jgi:acyl-CoA synthetase (AMP-forming)/AMP-acid ligase II
MARDGTRINFVGELLSRFSPTSTITDATSGQTFGIDEPLGRAIARAAADLLDRGLSDGQRFVLVCDVSAAANLYYLGAIYAGLVVIPVDPVQAVHSLNDIVESADADVVLSTTSRFRPAKPLPRGRFDLLTDPASSEPLAEAHQVTGDSVAALMPTSGTTGAPRLVMTSHGNLLANTSAIVESQRLTEADRAMLILPTAYCYGASVLQSHLWAGGSVVVDSRFMFPDKVLRAITEHGCTTFAGVPTTYKILLGRSNLRSIPLPGLVRFLQAGGPLPVAEIEAVIEAVGERDFYVMYGQTEATARITTLDPAQRRRKLGSVGHPVNHVEVEIRDDNGALPRGEPGEICVRGRSVAAGYFRDEASTDAVFADGWLHTRDYGRMDAEGFIWVESRAQEFLKIAGRRVSLREAEETAAAVEGVREVVACRAEHAETGDALALFFVPCENAEAEVVAATIARGLPKYWNCQVVVPIEAVPLNARGKVDRAALTERLAES